LESTILKHNQHWKNPYNGLYERKIFQTIIDKLHLRQIQILKGIRRSGKSTLFKLIINHLLESVEAKSILYVNLDDPYFSELYTDSKHLYRLLELSEKVTGVQVQYLFLDEIQNVKQWEKFVKSIYDNEVVKKIFVTGSNASLLDGEYATLLSGRYIQERVTAPSFSEVLKIKNIDNRFDLLDRKSEVLQIIDDMMEFGSFFEVLEESTFKRDIILSYYETIIFKDCIANNNLRDAKAFKEVTHFIISNSSNLYSYNSLAKATNSNDNTIKEYIRVLEDAYLCGEIKQYTYSLKEQIRSKKKIYINDNGFLAQTAFRFSKNLGSTFENLLYTEFVKQGYEIFFYHKDFECDFICKKEDSLIAVQACYELTAHNREREMNGLKKLKIEVDRKLLITYNQSEESDVGVEVLAFWDFCSHQYF
jgi:hypothetical protein